MRNTKTRTTLAVIAATFSMGAVAAPALTKTPSRSIGPS